MFYIKINIQISFSPLSYLKQQAISCLFLVLYLQQILSLKSLIYYKKIEEKEQEVKILW